MEILTIGKVSQRELEDLIEEKKESGVYLTVLGQEWEIINDNKVETFSRQTEMELCYIDNLLEAKKVGYRSGGTSIL